MRVRSRPVRLAAFGFGIGIGFVIGLGVIGFGFAIGFGFGFRIGFRIGIASGRLAGLRFDRRRQRFTPIREHFLQARHEPGRRHVLRVDRQCPPRLPQRARVVRALERHAGQAHDRDGVLWIGVGRLAVQPLGLVHQSHRQGTLRLEQQLDHVSPVPASMSASMPCASSSSEPRSLRTGSAITASTSPSMTRPRRGPGTSSSSRIRSLPSIASA